MPTMKTGKAAAKFRLMVVSVDEGKAAKQGQAHGEYE